MITAPDFFQWIEAHAGDDPARLRLKYGRERAFEILQIECRRKYAAKLADTLRANPEFIFPTALSGEQASSDALAREHASWVKEGMRVADLTAGLGIDAMAMAKRVGHDGHVVAVERDGDVADALRHNSRALTNIEIITSDCRTLLDVWAREGMRFDVVFIDPARRDAAGGRVYALSDCQPDVVEMLPLFKALADRLIIKASPMLDISHVLSQLADVARIEILGTPLECKELDIICDFTHKIPAEPKISAVTIGKGVHEVYTFTKADEAAATAETGIPKVSDYVFDPYPAVMKAAPFKLLCADGIREISANTHLWFSAESQPKFPGRIFRVADIVPYMSKHIKRYASRFPLVSVTVRNFDVAADALRKKLGVKDGPMRLFAVTAADGAKYLITCDENKS